MNTWFVRKVMSVILSWSNYTFERTRTDWNRFAHERAVVQSSPTIRRVRTGFSVKLVFVSCASGNASLVGTKDGHQVLYETWKAFLESHEEVSDEIHTGRPSTTTTAFLVTRFLADSKILTISQPPYSPNVAPSDFFLSPRLKNPMKGHHFGTVDKVEEAL